MKFNWKILIAVLAIVGILAWGVSSLPSRSYSGANLNFGVGSGPVTVTNPSEETLAVQLTSPRSGSFAVSSPNEVITGRSERQGTGNKSTQLFLFNLPPGISEFSVRGTEVSFVSTTETPLTATVQPASSTEMRTTLIVMAVVILGALFYISQATEHRWLSALRGQALVVPVPVPVIDPNSGQGPAIRTYGDNRSKS